MSMQQLLQNGTVWRGHNNHACQSESPKGVNTGHTALDDALPFGGWPRGALTEILHTYAGHGELQLLLPALKRLTDHQQYVVLIAPPALPYAPALLSADIDLSFLLTINSLMGADTHWSIEQVLRSEQCGAVLAWPAEQELNTKILRRLQLACETGNSCGFLFRDPRYRQQHSPAALRLQLHTTESVTTVELIKCRGRNLSPARLELSLAYPHA